MRPLRITLLLAVVPLFSGCGYVHFGRLPEASAMGDLKATETISNLSTENKLLKQELALVRRESDTMRLAMERGGTAASPEITKRLAESAEELAALRVSYAKLQAERDLAPIPGGAASAARMTELEDKLANSLRSYTQLQEENARLRTDLARARAENTSLSDQLKISMTQTEQAQASVTQLNTELLAHRDARLRAEQNAAATRAQLNAIIANGSGTLASARDSSAPTASGIQIPNTPPAAPPVTAELRTSPDRLQPASGSAATTYTVKEGDTLEKIARQYYGDATAWTKIYLANNAQLRDGRPLRPGMELEIPAK